MGTSEGKMTSRRRKERTVAKFLIRKFKPDHLSEGPSAGDRNTFEFLDTPDLERTEILFHGPKTKYIRSKAAQYLRSMDSAEKHPGKMAVTMRLVNVEQVSKEEYNDYLEILEQKKNKKAQAPKPAQGVPKEEKPRVVLPSKDAGTLTPADQVQRSPAMRTALDILERFHQAELLFGAKRRSAYVPLENKGVAIEYFYVNDSEALRAISVAESTLGYEPDIQKGEGDEHSVLRYELKDYGSVPVFMPHKTRKLMDVDPYTAANFILKHLLGFRYESHESRKNEFAMFTFVDRGTDTEKVLELFQKYGLTALAHDERKQNVYLAISEAGEKAFRRRGKKASEIIRELSDSYNKADGLAVVREVFKKLFDWRLLAEYFYTPNVDDEDDKLLYVAVTPASPELKKKLQDNYQKVISMLPPGVTGSFQGIRVANGKSFFIYFENRDIILEKIREKISAASKSRQNELRQGNASLIVESNGQQQDPETVPLNGSRDSHALDLLIKLVHPNELTLLKQKLGITEGLSEEKLAEHDQQRDEERRQELEKQFAGHVILDTSDPTVQKMMHEYNARLFRSLAEFRKVKQEA